MKILKEAFKDLKRAMQSTSDILVALDAIICPLVVVICVGFLIIVGFTGAPDGWNIVALKK